MCEAVCLNAIARGISSVAHGSSRVDLIRKELGAHGRWQLRAVLVVVVLEERVRVADHELAARRDARLEAAAAVLAHLLAREPRALDAVAVIVQRRELNDGTLEPLLLVGRRAAIPELARRGDVLADSGGRLIERRVEANGRLLAGLAPTLSRHGDAMARWTDGHGPK